MECTQTDPEDARRTLVQYRIGGTMRESDGDLAASVAFEDAAPVRTFPAWRGKRNYSGVFWMASSTTHVAFESLFERSFLMTVDRWPDVAAVASQPMWIRWTTLGRSHAPDYFVRRVDGRAVLVDVRPRERVDAEASVTFERTRLWARALGWEYLLFDEMPVVVERNLRFLLRYRDARWLAGLAGGDVDAVPDAASSLVGAADVSAWDVGSLGRALTDVGGLALVYGLLWHGALRVDLSQPLTFRSPVQIRAPR